jgi:polysaccharide export outer membrane protein
VTILEALGMAGDLTINGVRENVLVIREVDGEKTFTRVDLTSGDVIYSPVYFLSQNDVIYVEPNKAQINSSAYNRNTLIFISIAGILISVLSILTR